jgi:hypothetical protein
MEMLKKVAGYLKNEQGIETLEWIAIGGLVLAIAFLVYGPGQGTLSAALSGVVAKIAAALGTITLPGGAA